MSTKTNVALISLVDGAPDPYNFNDALQHVSGNPTFDWVSIDPDMGHRISHYVVHSEDCLGDVETVARAIKEAVNIKIKAGDEDLRTILVEKEYVEMIDLFTSPGEVLFKMYESDTWIHAIWRG
jgi:hypothetical protein